VKFGIVHFFFLFWGPVWSSQIRIRTCLNPDPITNKQCPSSLLTWSARLSKSQRNTEITHDPLLFTLVLRKAYFDSPKRLSRSTLHLKEGWEGIQYSCTLQPCNCDVLHRRLGADSDKILEVGRFSFILHLSGKPHLMSWSTWPCQPASLPQWPGWTELCRVVDPYWFNADPDPAFFLIADPDTDPAPDPVPNTGFWWPKIGKNLQL